MVSFVPLRRILGGENGGECYIFGRFDLIYALLEKWMVLEDRPRDIEKKVFTNLWKGPTPFRVVGFYLETIT